MSSCDPRWTRRTVLSALGLAAGWPRSTQAHHGWQGYLDDKFTLTGVVRAVHSSGAHGHLEVEADGGVWNVVLGPPYRNRRAGVTEDTIPIGATVTAEGRRHRDPERLEMKTERLRLDDQVFDIYPERL